MSKRKKPASRVFTQSYVTPPFHPYFYDMEATKKYEMALHLEFLPRSPTWPVGNPRLPWPLPARLTSSVPFKTLSPYFVVFKTEFFDEEGGDETHGSHTCERQEDSHEGNPVRVYDSVVAWKGMVYFAEKGDETDSFAYIVEDREFAG